MNISGAQADKIKAMLQGAAVAFVVVAIGGQYWPGYMLDSNVKAEVEKSVEVTVNASASIVCQQLYMGAADSGTKLVALRALDTYRISQDASVNAAAEQAIKLFADAKITPAPSSYRVKSDCGEQLHKKPEKAAELQKK